MDLPRNDVAGNLLADGLHHSREGRTEDLLRHGTHVDCRQCGAIRAAYTALWRYRRREKSQNPQATNTIGKNVMNGTRSPNTDDNSQRARPRPLTLPLVLQRTRSRDLVFAAYQAPLALPTAHSPSGIIATHTIRAIGQLSATGRMMRKSYVGDRQTLANPPHCP